VNSADTAHAKTRFSIRSLLTLVAFTALVFVALKQHQQNQQMQIRLEALSSQIGHLDASVEDAHAKLEFLRDMVSDEPILSVEDVLSTSEAVQTGG
jgi:hypothetical protein